jgi:putative endonuclease
MKPGFTYIMGSPTGTLYIGVTSDLEDRIWKHKNGMFDGFSKKHNCTRLLYYEQHEVRRHLGMETHHRPRTNQGQLTSIQSKRPHHQIVILSAASRLHRDAKSKKPRHRQPHHDRPTFFHHEIEPRKIRRHSERSVTASP